MINASTLVDDQGTPIRWKAATVIAISAFLITLAIAIANAGAKSEQLSTAKSDIEALKTLYPRVERQETKMEYMLKTVDGMDKKIDKLLERRR